VFPATPAAGASELPGVSLITCMKRMRARDALRAYRLPRSLSSYDALLLLIFRPVRQYLTPISPSEPRHLAPFLKTAVNDMLRVQVWDTDHIGADIIGHFTPVPVHLTHLASTFDDP